MYILLHVHNSGDEVDLIVSVIQLLFKLRTMYLPGKIIEKHKTN